MLHAQNYPGEVVKTRTRGNRKSVLSGLDVLKHVGEVLNRRPWVAIDFDHAVWRPERYAIKNGKHVEIRAGRLLCLETDEKVSGFSRAEPQNLSVGHPTADYWRVDNRGERVEGFRTRATVNAPRYRIRNWGAQEENRLTGDAAHAGERAIHVRPKLAHLARKYLQRRDPCFKSLKRCDLNGERRDRLLKCGQLARQDLQGRDSCRQELQRRDPRFKPLHGSELSGNRRNLSGNRRNLLLERAHPRQKL